MLNDSLRLILPDRLGHHIDNVVHDSGSQLKVILRLDTLLGHGLRHALAITSFELTSKQVAKPGITLVTSGSNRE